MQLMSPNANFGGRIPLSLMDWRPWLMNWVVVGGRLTLVFSLSERYDTIEEFNVDSKAECDHLNLAYVAEKKKLKQTTPVPV